MKVKLFAVFLSTITFSTCIITFNLSPSIGAVQAENYGFINKKGLLVIAPQFSEVKNFSQGLAAVEIGSQQRVYIDGNPIPGTAVEIAGKWGYIDGTGKQVISNQFDLANRFSQGLAAVSIGNKCGYINKTGKVVVQPKFSSCENFSEGLAAVKTLAQ